MRERERERERGLMKAHQRTTIFDEMDIVRLPVLNRFRSPNGIQKAGWGRGFATALSSELNPGYTIAFPGFNLSCSLILTGRVATLCNSCI